MQVAAGVNDFRYYSNGSNSFYREFLLPNEGSVFTVYEISSFLLTVSAFL